MVRGKSEGGEVLRGRSEGGEVLRVGGKNTWEGQLVSGMITAQRRSDTVTCTMH